MFLGTFQHSIDNKGRLIIPSKFRDEIGASKLVITRGVDSNLVVFTEEGFNEYVSNLTSLKGSPQKSRNLKRFLAASADEVKLDSQGRILISEGLRAYAGVEKEVVVTGNMESFEIWNPETWDNQSALLGDADEMRNELESLGIMI